MKLNLNAAKIDMTPSLKRYVEMKIAPLGKYISRYERHGEAELYIELARATKHHKHGDVFYAEAALELPKKRIRAQCYDVDIRSAIDKVKDTLRMEIGKYREISLGKSPARGRERIRKTREK
mgnify:CR=1 FL=1